MSFNQVKELRKEGKLQDALAIAIADLEARPEDIWNKRAIGWVYYDFAKIASENKDFEGLKQNIEKIITLNLPADEIMLFSNFIWPIAKYLFHIGTKEDYNRNEVTTLFNLCKSLSFEKPSDNYSVLLKAFLKFNHTWLFIKDFIDWWGFENLRSEDFLKETMPNGKMVMAVAEQVYIAYARKLLEGDGNPENPFEQNRKVNKDHVNAFLDKLDVIIEKYPDYQYPPFFKAKLLLTLGSSENVLSAFLPFAKKKKNEFWVWDLLAEIFHSDINKVIACNSKALSCKVSPEFLVKIRQSFVKILVEYKHFDEAKTEIIQLVKARTANNWRIPSDVLNWQNESWYASASDLGNNDAFYKKHLAQAEELLFHDIVPLIGIIEFVNKDKKVLNFIVNKTIQGFFNYDKFIENPAVGDSLLLRLEKRKGEEGEYYMALTADKTQEQPSLEIKKDFDGTIRRKEDAGFAFIDDIFIEPRFIKDHDLINGTLVKGKAIISYNRKKEAWSWKAIEVNKSSLEA